VRHVPNETLLEHAGGQLDLALRVLVEAHLELCPACLAEHAALAAPGGRLLAETAPAPPDGKLWDRIEAELPAAAGGAPPAGPASGLASDIPLPAAARAELGAALEMAPPPRWWRLGLGGARMTELAHDAESGVRLLVGQMPPGLRFPRHLHLGFEHVVVLAGGYDDERGEFVAGDFGVYEPGSEHGPETLDGDSCWILFRLDAPVRFKGWRGLAQRLFD
jgi:putative transcriptional regulator